MSFSKVTSSSNRIHVKQGSTRWPPATLLVLINRTGVTQQTNSRDILHVATLNRPKRQIDPPQHPPATTCSLTQQHRFRQPVTAIPDQPTWLPG